MRTLVTGGAGFIGSNLADALLARGDDVLVVDDLSTGREENVSEGIRLERVSIADRPRLEALVAEHRPEVVFHLAAHIDVRHSVADPAADAGVNVEGTLNVLYAEHTAGASRMVLCSAGGSL